MWHSRKDTSWLSCVSYLVLSGLWLDVSQHPGDSSCHRENVGRRRRDLCDRRRLDRTCDADDGKWNLILVLFFLFSFFLLKRWSFQADRETAQAFSWSTGGTKNKVTYFAFWPFQPAAEKPCVSKAGGYCKKVQSTAFCLGNKLISAVQFFLFLQLPLRHDMYR